MVWLHLCPPGCCRPMLFDNVQRTFNFFAAQRLFTSVFIILAKHCNFIAITGYCHNMSSVCHLSETRVYCDKTAEVSVMQFSLNVAQCLCLPRLTTKFEGALNLGAQSRVGWFSTSRRYISETVLGDN